MVCGADGCVRKECVCEAGRCVGQADMWKGGYVEQAVVWGSRACGELAGSVGVREWEMA